MKLPNVKHNDLVSWSELIKVAERVYRTRKEEIIELSGIVDQGRYTIIEMPPIIAKQIKDTIYRVWYDETEDE